MSKSVSGSFITLTDSLDDIRAKIRAVPTASEVGGEMSKGLKALFAFYDLFDAAKGENFKQQFQEGTLRFVELKDTLAAIIFSTLQPLQARRAELEADPEYIDRVIAEGAQKAGALAQETVTDVRRKMGLL